MGQRERVVEIAAAEVGRNAGGRKFWNWYGFSSRVSWCACFVSWVLDQAGVKCGDLRPYIYKTDTPEEAAAITAAVEDPECKALISKGCMQMLEFYERKEMRTGDVPAEPGDIVFFDWDPDLEDGPEHVGIVESVEGSDPDTQILHVIEGNCNDEVCRRSYRYRETKVYATCRPGYDQAGSVEAPFDMANGDEGDAVKLLQMALEMHGYSVGYAGVDGELGSYTEEALRDFQRDHGLVVDGIAGTETWTALCGK